MLYLVSGVSVHLPYSWVYKRGGILKGCSFVDLRGVSDCETKVCEISYSCLSNKLVAVTITFWKIGKNRSYYNPNFMVNGIFSATWLEFLNVNQVKVFFD